MYVCIYILLLSLFYTYIYYMLDQNSIFLLILGTGIWLLIGYLASKYYHTIDTRHIRKTAIKQSKNVISGQVHEKLAPILPNFPYNFKDLMFMGKWVDYIVFDGLHEGNLKQIVFLEIKTWRSRQNKREKEIQHTVDAKRIKYEIMRLNTY